MTRQPDLPGRDDACPFPARIPPRGYSRHRLRKMLGGIAPVLLIAALPLAANEPETFGQEPEQSGEVNPAALTTTAMPSSEMEAAETNPQPDSAFSLSPEFSERFDALEADLLMRFDHSEEQLSEIIQELGLVSGNLAAPPPATDLAPVTERLDALSHSLNQLRQEGRTPPASLPLDPDPGSEKLLILVLIILLLVAVLIFLQLFGPKRGSSGRGSTGVSRRDLQEIRDVLGAIQEKVSASSPAPAAKNGPDFSQALQRMEARLEANEGTSREAARIIEELPAQFNQLTSHFEKLESQLASLQERGTADAQHQQTIRDLEEKNTRLASELNSLRQENSAQTDRSRAETASLQQNLDQWNGMLPGWVLSLELDQPWSTLIPALVSHKEDPHAARFLGAIMSLESQLRNSRTGKRELGRALAETGETAYALLTHSLRRQPDEVRKSIRTWIEALQRELQAGQQSFRISQVYPGDAFQMNTMEAIDSISGNRLHVDQVLSWLIEDTSESPPKVLHHAKVITA